ncbi:hypothetical protein J2S40_002037 [Nocardioides luteus]|uniref:DUF3592 domain-containing protein n=1 Tax=Nocardioides luteus TaxID=1844 RepID=A0ABQ5T231_9ACTN|nr:hypothetical protein [Nocardioides luteus]MDR7310979.1 hypothetical protein [Nocardioides luteus]GGR39391.1 hypothetical protein GCM10010197_00170 [Nocardioides luteus]GLJ69241.1 hypothetical protein GCM10017579_32770 [Nocardioides luteus]
MGQTEKRQNGVGCLTMLLLAPVPFLLVGLVVAYVWFVVIPGNRDLTDHTGHAAGFVVEATKTGASKQLVTYSYEVAGRTYEDTLGVYEHTDVGDELEICYVPGDPRKHHVVDFSDLACGRDNPR